MDALQTIALSKAVSEKEVKDARPSLSPGKHLVDFQVRIQGALSVGQDYESAQTARAMSLEAVATALCFAGVTREAAVNALVRVALGNESEADEQRQKAVESIVGDLKARFAALPKEKRNGQVRAALVVSLVGEKMITEVSEVANVQV